MATPEHITKLQMLLDAVNAASAAFDAAVSAYNIEASKIASVVVSPRVLTRISIAVSSAPIELQSVATQQIVYEKPKPVKETNESIEPASK